MGRTTIDPTATLLPTDAFSESLHSHKYRILNPVEEKVDTVSEIVKGKEEPGCVPICRPIDNEISIDPSNKTTSKVEGVGASQLSGDMIEDQLATISAMVDEALLQPAEEIDFHRVQALIYRLVMLMMRRTVKTDQEYITEMGLKIQVHAEKIKDMHNTWPELTLTVIAGGVSIFGGVIGFAPITTIFKPETARALAQASQAVGTAGTGISGIGSLFKERVNAMKGYEQHLQGSAEKKVNDKKDTKQGHNRQQGEAKQAYKDNDSAHHQTMASILQGR